MASNNHRNDGNSRGQSGREGAMSVREAGQRGGKATSAAHGRGFLEGIGPQGGEKGGHRVGERVGKGERAEGGNRNKSNRDGGNR